MKHIDKIAILLVAAIAAAAMIVPAGAQLAPFQYAFPSIFHNAEVTAFTRDVLSAANNENVFVSFTGGGCGPGGFGLGFPTIVQTVEQSYYAEHTDYYHSEETTAINYPYLSLGAVPFAGLPCGLPYDGAPYGGWY